MDTDAVTKLSARVRELETSCEAYKNKSYENVSDTPPHGTTT